MLSQRDSVHRCPLLGATAEVKLPLEAGPEWFVLGCEWVVPNCILHSLEVSSKDVWLLPSLSALHTLVIAGWSLNITLISKSFMTIKVLQFPRDYCPFSLQFFFLSLFSFFKKVTTKEAENIHLLHDVPSSLIVIKIIHTNCLDVPFKVYYNGQIVFS